MPTTLAILALFLPGFIAMEIAYHLGPRNFRSSSETYKYVIAVLLGAIVFGITTACHGQSLASGWEQITEPKLFAFRRLLSTIFWAVTVGFVWHFAFTHGLPRFYRVSRAVKLKIFGHSRHFHGPVKVFDTAMDLMDDCMVMVFLKDGRCLKGGLVAYPDIDGDTGLVLRVVAYGHLPEPKTNWQPKFEPDLASNLESLIWIPGSQIEYLSVLREAGAKPALAPVPLRS